MFRTLKAAGGVVTEKDEDNSCDNISNSNSYHRWKTSGFSLVDCCGLHMKPNKSFFFNFKNQTSFWIRSTFTELKRSRRFIIYWHLVAKADTAHLQEHSTFYFRSPHFNFTRKKKPKHCGTMASTIVKTVQKQWPGHIFCSVLQETDKWSS